MPDTSQLGLGALFLASFLAPSLNFFLPARPVLIAVALDVVHPWWLVTGIGALGSTLGTIPLYAAVRSVEHTATVRRWYRLPGIRALLQCLRRRTFLAILVLVLTPLPDQLIGITAGAERYPLRKLLAATFAGRLLFYGALTLFAEQHADLLLRWWRAALEVVGM